MRVMNFHGKTDLAYQAAGKSQCRHCGNESVQKEVMKRRRIRGLPSGTPEVFFDLTCIECIGPGCRSQKMEELAFSFSREVENDPESGADGS